MRQNTLYLIIGALVVAVAALGFTVYRQEAQPNGVEIKVNDKGISVQGN